VSGIFIIVVVAFFVTLVIDVWLSRSAAADGRSVVTIDSPSLPAVAEFRWPSSVTLMARTK